MQENLDFKKTLYKNRQEATADLISLLPKEQMKKENWILLALSHGGAQIAEKIAREFALSFDIFLVQEIGAPNNMDCQIAMVSETKEIVIHEALMHAFAISEDYIYAEAQRRFHDEIMDNVYKFRK